MSDNSHTIEGGTTDYSFANSHIFIVDTAASVILRSLVISNGYSAGGGSVTATYVIYGCKVRSFINDAPAVFAARNLARSRETRTANLDEKHVGVAQVAWKRA